MVIRTGASDRRLTTGESARQAGTSLRGTNHAAAQEGDKELRRADYPSRITRRVLPLQPAKTGPPPCESARSWPWRRDASRGIPVLPRTACRIIPLPGGVHARGAELPVLWQTPLQQQPLQGCIVHHIWQRPSPQSRAPHRPVTASHVRSEVCSWALKRVGTGSTRTPVRSSRGPPRERGRRLRPRRGLPRRWSTGHRERGPRSQGGSGSPQRPWSGPTAGAHATPSDRRALARPQRAAPGRGLGRRAPGEAPARSRPT
jgi:hypothetical protein